MRRYKVVLEVSVIVRSEDEAHAMSDALLNVHDGTIRFMAVEEYDECSTKQTPVSRPSAHS